MMKCAKGEVRAREWTRAETIKMPTPKLRSGDAFAETWRRGWWSGGGVSTARLWARGDDGAISEDGVIEKSIWPDALSSPLK